jgi:hypothetical protein
MPGNPGEHCFHCDVSGECLEFAIVTKQRHGIYGGINEVQRGRMINNRISARRRAARIARNAKNEQDIAL